MSPAQNHPAGPVPFVGAAHMTLMVRDTGIERFLGGLAGYIEEDFRRWPQFDRGPRLAAASPDGSIRLSQATDGAQYAFKYEGGAGWAGRQMGAALGVLANAETGAPSLIAEMALLSALRCAATSALAGKHLKPWRCKTMAVIGNGGLSELQVLAFKALLGIEQIRLYDIDPAANRRCAANLMGRGLSLVPCASILDAVEDADIITTVTADSRFATILADDLVAGGIHINAVGGDRPGKTELHRDILLRSDIFVEHEPLARLEGEAQQLAADHPVTELWRVITGEAPGRRDGRQVTVFDSVGYAIADFSALRFVRDQLRRVAHYVELDLTAGPGGPHGLFGMLTRAGAE